VTTPHVTAVMPTHDRARTFGATLRSLLAQHDVDLEVVVVDDGSTDDTPAVLSRVDDQRVRVVRREEAGGPSAARNAGIEAARAPWIAFCDDDDRWAPDKLAAQLAALDATPGAAWACTGSVLVDDGGRIIDHERPPSSGDALPALLAGNVIPGGGSSVLVRADEVRAVGGFEVARRHSEDWDLWIRLAERSPIASVDRPLVAYRIWPGSASRATEAMHRSWTELTDRYRALAEARGVAPRRDGHERWLAKQELRSGRRLGAARRYAAAAAAGGGLRDAARAALALGAPGVLERGGEARATSAVPQSWREEAAAWIAGAEAEVAP